MRPCAIKNTRPGCVIQGGACRGLHGCPGTPIRVALAGGARGSRAGCGVHHGRRGLSSSRAQMVAEKRGRTVTVIAPAHRRPTDRKSSLSNHRDMRHAGLMHFCSRIYHGRGDEAYLPRNVGGDSAGREPPARSRHNRRAWASRWRVAVRGARGR